MYGESLRYRNPLTGAVRPCFIAQADFGPCSSDQETGTQFRLYQNPIGCLLDGI